MPVPAEDKLHTPMSLALRWGELGQEMELDDIKVISVGRSCMALFAHRIAGGQRAAEAALVVQRYRRVLKEAPSVLRDMDFEFGLKHLHALTIGEYRIPSAYRKHHVYCAGRGTNARRYQVSVSPEMVPDAIRDLKASIWHSPEISDYERAWLVNFELLNIHPFPDANGRVARAILAVMLRRATGADLIIDLCRPLRSVFLQHNLLLRTPRSAIVYRRWVKIMEGLLGSEYVLFKRICANINALSISERIKLRALYRDILAAIESGERADIMIARHIAESSACGANVLSMIYG